MLNNKKEIIYKILSIYFISTFLFLSSIFIVVTYYQETYEIEKQHQAIREYKRYIINFINTSDLKNFNLINNNDKIEVKILKDNKILFSNFSSNNNIKLQKRFYYDKDFIYYFNFIKVDNNEIQYILKSDNKNQEIYNFKKKLFIFLMIILFASSFVAHSLVKIIIKSIAENMNKLDEFLKDSTHEIKSPLTIINMCIETIDEETLCDKNKKRINNLNYATKTLNNIYENLVEVHFNNKEKKAASFIEFDKILEERIELFKSTLLKNNLTIKSEISNSQIKIDQFDLTKIIDNLLLNSIKYARNSSIIHIKLSQNIFEIQNISSYKLPNNFNTLFERYYRANTNLSGFGIGLYIVKKLCDEANLKINSTLIKDNSIKFSISWNIY
ncbi:HAMP domain-containing sensor histidine kinase [Aliarcobacter butzleri]|uniref:sensor histidine kinase n=1 Tax=Aliarcobacter butzleri TaxID=28197 RepID=UPI00263D8E75|nr:HAMP domain-containing sensor histidine kinase [Aliarcobacter butzleri]MDN5043290.1 HAMP domain-containing sensor histidine kinase [Aliarcobacter butzleri]